MKEILYRAETEQEEEVEGYYFKDQITIKGQHYSFIHYLFNKDSSYEIKPETIQIKLTNGEWRKIDEVEVVAKVNLCKCDSSEAIETAKGIICYECEKQK